MTTDVSTQTDELTTASGDSEAIAAAEQAEQDAIGEHVAAFGCRAADRVFLAVIPGQCHKPYPLAIPECPGCGNPHAIIAMPRPRRPHDEIAVSVDPPEDTPKDSGSGRRQVSDAAIFDAIPVGRDVPAPTVAESVGYAGTTAAYSFMRRVKRINAAAVKAGSPEPFNIVPGSGGRPAMISRTRTAGEADSNG